MWMRHWLVACVMFGSLGCSGGDDSGKSNAANTGGSSTQGGSASQSGSSTHEDPGPDPNGSACDFVLYDGEPDSHPSSEAGLVYVGWPMETNHAQDTDDAKFGSTALQSVLDPGGTCCGTFYYSWSNWDMDQSKVLDVTAFDSLEFWIKVESGLYWNLQVELQDVNHVSSFTGNDIHIADHIEGNNIDMTWRQAKVPLDLFDTNGIDLKHVSSFIIEGDRAVTYDLDDVKFTKASCQ
jgi:hypothetical protein